MTTQRQKIGFDDDKVVSNQRQERPDRYKGKKGRQDRVRIMTPLTRCFGATVKNKADPEKAFFAYSIADPEDAYKAVVEGDEAALKRCENQCPLFKRGYPVAERFACLLFHIESSDSKGRKKDVRQSIPWVFAPDKYVALRNIQRTLKINPKTKKPIPLQAIEILIDCSDDTFQKMTFIPVSEASQLAMKFGECLEACKDDFDPPGDVNGTCSLVEDTIAAESKQNLIRSLDRAESGDTGGSQEADEFATAARPQAGGKKPAPRPDPGAAAEVDDSNEFNIDDPPPEDEPVTPGPAAPRRVGGKPVGKPAPAPAQEDSELDDLDIPF